MTRVPLPALFDTMVGEGKRLLSLGLDAAVALDGERTEADFPEARLVPAKAVAFKKSTFQDLDCEAILRRSPEVVIIDNLLHVNISSLQTKCGIRMCMTFLTRALVSSPLPIRHLERI